MASKQEYLDNLQVAVQELLKCGAHWLRTVPVHEEFRGQTVWEGHVEVFGLIGHPEAQRCYAWSHAEGQDNQSARFVVVLEIPPVDSALRAVQAQIVKHVKRNPPSDERPQ